MYLGDITDKIAEELHDIGNEIWSLNQLEEYVDVAIRNLWGGEIIYGRETVDGSLTSDGTSLELTVPSGIDLVQKMYYGDTTNGWSQITDYYQHGTKLYLDNTIDSGYTIRLFGVAKYQTFVPKTELATALASTGGTTVVLTGNVSEYPTSGTIKIEDEEITYTGLTVATKTLTGCTRAANGTDDVAHSVSTVTNPVYVYPIHEYLDGETEQLLKYFSLSEAMGSLLNNRAIFAKYVSRTSDQAIQPEDIEASINYWRVQFERRRAELGNPIPSQLRQGA